MSQPPFGDPGVCPRIALFSSTTNQSPIGGTFSTAWSRLIAWPDLAHVGITVHHPRPNHIVLFPPAIEHPFQLGDALTYERLALTAEGLAEVEETKRRTPNIKPWVDWITKWVVGEYINTRNHYFLKRRVFSLGPLMARLNGELQFADSLKKPLLDLVDREFTNSFTMSYLWLEWLGEGAVTPSIPESIHAWIESSTVIFRRSSLAPTQTALTDFFDVIKTVGEAAPNLVVSLLLNLIERFDSHDDNCVQHVAIEALGRLGEKAATEEVVNALLNLVERSDDDYTQQVAAETLGQLGRKAATDASIVVLLGLIERSDDEFIKRRSIKALGRLGEKAATEEVINALLNLIERIDYNDGNDDVDALLNLIERIDYNDSKDDNGIAHAAIVGLGQLGKKAATEEVINALLNLIERIDYNNSKDDNGIAHAAIVALGQLGEKAATEEVVNALLNLVERSDDDYTQQAAAATLGQLGRKGATDAVIAVLLGLIERSNDYTTPQVAADALVRLAKEASTDEVATALLDLIEQFDKNDNFGNLQAAVEALGQLGEKAATSEKINALIDLGESFNDEFIKSLIIETLGRWGAIVATARPIRAMLSLLEGSANLSTRCVAAHAIGSLGENAARDSVIASLAGLLRDDHLTESRNAAADALRRLGKKAGTEEVIAALINSLRWLAYSNDVSPLVASLCSLAGSPRSLKALSENISEAETNFPDFNSFCRWAMRLLADIGDSHFIPVRLLRFADASGWQLLEVRQLASLLR